MHVLVVYAHPNPASFTHAILEQVERGLFDGGHTYEVVDLYAIGFNPVFSNHDSTSFIHHSVPASLLDRSRLEAALVARRVTRCGVRWPDGGFAGGRSRTLSGCSSRTSRPTFGSSKPRWHEPKD
jgi:Flavodoxin-like fold